MPEPSPENPATLEATSKPFWQSKTLIGLLVLLISRLATHYGFAVSETDPMVAALASNLADGIGGLLVVWGRATATHSLTLGKAPAAVPAIVVWLSVSMAVAALLCAVSGCASADTAFRSRVASQSVGVTAAYDPLTGGVTGSAATTLTFRDPGLHSGGK